jgi:16S rRNA (uracil1498-N3)-methyltransferase
MAERFYAPQCAGGQILVLEGAEARHLAKVMRASAGDELWVFDGRGTEFPARVLEVRKDRVQLDVGEGLFEPRMPRHPLTLAVAVPKGPRMDLLVELSAAYGAAQLILMDAERSVAAAHAAGDEKKARWERIAVETAKQCGRNMLMGIASMRFAEVIDVAERPPVALIAAITGGSRLIREFFPLSAPALVLVGPEGGFSSAEIEAARERGFTAVSLGAATLRVEHAAAAIAALGCLEGPND